MKRQPNLLEVIDTGTSASRLTSLLNSRQQQANQDADDGDNDKQFDKRERRTFAPRSGINATGHGNTSRKLSSTNEITKAIPGRMSLS
jgi:hypothetical protein